ncbi:MAG: RlmE family RNA methyltransferase [Desulfatibacillaceae bacterium]
MKPKGNWQDSHTRRAKKQGFPARSVYKLEELQNKYRILGSGHKVLDLGCAPGSWLLYAAKVASPGGHVLGIDIQEVQLPENTPARVMQADIFDLSPAQLEEIGAGYDVVLSDMAPNTTGIRGVDALRSVALCEHALDLADRVLSPGGTFVCKIFQGAGFDQFLAEVKKQYGKHKVIKPQTTRKKSKEIYIIGFNKQGGNHVRSQ